MNQQAKEEIIIFKKFISVYPDKVNDKTIKKLGSPKPDIGCELMNGQKLYFELTECVDSAIAKSTGDVSKEISKKGITEPFLYYSPAIAFSEKRLFFSSMGKFSKSYEAEGPIELISYFYQQSEPLGDALKIYKDFAKSYFNQSPFQRVWVYSTQQNEILFRFP